MGRNPCHSKEDMNRGAWTEEEDRILKAYIEQHGKGRWNSIPKKAGLKRCGKSCRLRWLNYLRPGIKRGNIADDEEDLIMRLHKLLGNRWSLIAGRLPGRTDNEIKNYWNTCLKKKVDAGLQPDLYEPLADESGTTPVRTKAVRLTEMFVTPNNINGETGVGNVADDVALESNSSEASSVLAAAAQLEGMMPQCDLLMSLHASDHCSPFDQALDSNIIQYSCQEEWEQQFEDLTGDPTLRFLSFEENWLGDDL